VAVLARGRQERRPSISPAPPLLRLLASAGSVALVTAVVAVAKPHLPVLSLGVLYVSAVLPVALLWGLRYALPVALASMACFDLFFVLPTQRLAPGVPRNWLALPVYAVAAVALSDLARRTRRHADLAEQARGRLADEQAALRRVATLVAHGVPAAEIFAAVAEETGRLLDTDSAHMLRYEPDGTVTMVAGWSRAGDHLPVGSRQTLDCQSASATVSRNGRPARIDSYTGAAGSLAAQARRLGIRSTVGCPITVEGRLWGLLAVNSAQPQALPADTEARIAAFAELVATAIGNTQARAELAASRTRIIQSADETRRRIEHDLHDGLQQQLVSMGLNLRAAQATVPAELLQLRTELALLANELGRALEELRELSRGIHPAILSQGGLGLALRALARRSAVPVDLEVDLQTRLPAPVEVAAYYVVAEALANAAKHAHATVAQVDVRAGEGRLQLSVADDGVGGADPVRGSGLVGLGDRVQALGGTLTVHSPAGQGTRLLVDLPVEVDGD
jgi:signal transduction histidine kinase